MVFWVNMCDRRTTWLPLSPAPLPANEARELATESNRNQVASAPKYRPLSHRAKPEGERARERGIVLPSALGSGATDDSCQYPSLRRNDRLPHCCPKQRYSPPGSVGYWGPARPGYRFAVSPWGDRSGISRLRLSIVRRNATH
jgi:hypothetical protein